MKSVADIIKLLEAMFIPSVPSFCNRQWGKCLTNAVRPKRSRGRNRTEVFILFCFLTEAYSVKYFLQSQLTKNNHKPVFKRSALKAFPPYKVFFLSHAAFPASQSWLQVSSVYLSYNHIFTEWFTLEVTSKIIYFQSS